MSAGGFDSESSLSEAHASPPRCQEPPPPPPPQPTAAPAKKPQRSRRAAPAAPVGKRRRARPEGGTAARKRRTSEAMKKLREVHRRKTNRAAAETLEAAVDAYADSSLREVVDEARAHEAACVAALQRVRRASRANKDVPLQLRAHGVLVRKIRASVKDGAANGSASLLTECADTLEEQSRVLRQLEKNFERLASSFGANSARALAVVRMAGDRMSHAAPVDVGSLVTISEPSGQTSVAVMPTAQSTQVVAPSDRAALAKRLAEVDGRAAAISEREHPRMALVVGDDGKSAIGISTRPGRVLVDGAPGADYVPFSVAREQVAAQSCVDAHVSRRLGARRRVAREKQRKEQRLRQMLALEQAAASAIAAPALRALESSDAGAGAAPAKLAAPAAVGRHNGGR